MERSDTHYWGGGTLSLHTSHFPSSPQGVHYSYLELSPGEPVQEGDPRFRSALTAHPVSDPVHVYQLHKAFARAELERTYQEIQELQVWSGLGVGGRESGEWGVRSRGVWRVGGRG